MAFIAGSLAVALIVIVATRQITREITGAECRHRLKALEKHEHRR